VETVTIACIVEGHGEVQALPVLLRRIVAEIDPGTNLWMPPPYRINRSKLARPGMLEDVVQTQGDRVKGAGGVLVLVDADKDCPADLGPSLLRRAQASRSDRKVAVVLANREFEAWFLAPAMSLAGAVGFQSYSSLLRIPKRSREPRSGSATRCRVHPTSRPRTRPRSQ